MTDDLQSYFELNDDWVNWQGTLCAMGKATLRGKAKAFLKGKEREKNQIISYLESRVLRLECEYLATCEVELQRQLNVDRVSLRQFYIDKAKQIRIASTRCV